LEKRVREIFKGYVLLGWAPTNVILELLDAGEKMKATKKRVLDEDLSKLVLPCGELRNRQENSTEDTTPLIIYEQGE